MASKDPRVRRAIIRLANATQRKPYDPAEVAAARRDMEAARIEHFIETALADAPPLTAEQRATLVRLLTADGGEGK